jgi:hypothetical protein
MSPEDDHVFDFENGGDCWFCGTNVDVWEKLSEENPDMEFPCTERFLGGEAN